MNVLAIIPARRGSKGVPEKNVRLLNGKPLIAYTIEAAKKSALISKIVITTDDDKVEDIAKKYGIQIIRRPSGLARDDTPMIPVIQHAVKETKEKFDYVVLLQPTSPFRNPKDIDDCIAKMKKGFNGVYSVAENKESPFWSFVIEGDTLEPLIPFDTSKTLRQEARKSYYFNGAVYVYRAEIIMDAKSFPLDNISFIIMPAERSLEIDTEYEFKIAEVMMRDLY